MFKFRSNSGQKRLPEPEQKCCSGTGTGILVDLWVQLVHIRKVSYHNSREKWAPIQTK